MRPRSTVFLFSSVVLLLLTGGADSQTPTLTVEVSDHVPRVGDEVAFTCVVTGPAGNTLTFNKVIVRPEKMTSEQISINDVLSKPYKDLSRFKVTKKTDGVAQTFILRISGVQFEDSGHYACSATGIDNLYAMEILEVYRKPQNVSFVGYSTTNAVVVLHEDERANLICFVPSVLPLPTIELWLEQSVVGPNVVTDQFLLASELNILCAENPLEKTNCPLHMSYNMVAKNRDFVASSIHDEKQLTCKTRMKQLDRDELSTTVTLDVRYAPKFVCAGIWNGTVNMTDLRIICQVHANPPSSRSKNSATVKTPGLMILIRPGEYSPQYSLEDTPLASTDLKATSLEFVIKTVTEEHFSYVYYLYAVNDVGNTTKELRIAQTRVCNMVVGSTEITLMTDYDVPSQDPFPIGPYPASQLSHFAAPAM